MRINPLRIVEFCGTAGVLFNMLVKFSAVSLYFNVNTVSDLRRRVWDRGKYTSTPYLSASDYLTYNFCEFSGSIILVEPISIAFKIWWYKTQVLCGKRCMGYPTYFRLNSYACSFIVQMITLIRVNAWLLPRWAVLGSFFQPPLYQKGYYENAIFWSEISYITACF